MPHAKQKECQSRWIPNPNHKPYPNPNLNPNPNPNPKPYPSLMCVEIVIISSIVLTTVLDVSKLW